MLSISTRYHCITIVHIMAGILVHLPHVHHRSQPGWLHMLQKDSWQHEC